MLILSPERFSCGVVLLPFDPPGTNFDRAPTTHSPKPNANAIPHCGPFIPSLNTENTLLP